jgi:hypothetical protein
MNEYRAVFSSNGERIKINFEIREPQSRIELEQEARRIFIERFPSTKTDGNLYLLSVRKS